MNITRGDSKKFKFGPRIDADGEEILDEPEKVYFTVKKSYRSSAVLIQKTLADMEINKDGVYHFELAPEDTQKLEYGIYVYDIEVIDNGGKYVQTIAKGKFVIDGEATTKKDEV